ncbi:MAG TPA: diacylglycerol kinase family protein, partial [Streptosporangiaceae bacterium]
KLASWLAAELPKATVIETDAGQDLSAQLRRVAAEARILGVAGGDGTVRAASAIALETGLPLLVVPAGTFNRFALVASRICRCPSGGRTADLAVRRWRAGHRRIRLYPGQVPAAANRLPSCHRIALRAAPTVLGMLGRLRHRRGAGLKPGYR